MSDDGAVLRDLLDRTEALLTRYVVFRSPAQRTAVALWIAHAHVLPAFSVTPYLAVYSPEKQAGKTRLLEVLKELTPRAWHAIQPTEAVLFRKIDKVKPTLLLDETDALFAKGATSDRTEAVRAVLNGGYRRGATVDRVNLKKKNPLESYEIFCAKCICGIGVLPATVSDRSIPIELTRRTKDEHIARFFLREAQPLLHPVREALATWALDAFEALRDARPDLPQALADRAAEVWEPLLAIAAAAGSEWPARAQAAALALHQGRTDADSVNVLLLGAIAAVLQPEPAHSGDPWPKPIEEIFTVDLLHALIEREGEPWPGWWGKDVDQAKDGETPRKAAMELARHLKPFGVQPRKLRDGTRTGNGYALAEFADAFLRYRPSGRNNGTTVAAQGENPFRPTPGENEVGTPETLGGEGLCRRSDLKAPGREKGSTVKDAVEVFGATVLEREPGCDDDDQTPAWKGDR